MLTKQSSPVDIEYHIEQMKVLLISSAESKIIEDILDLERLVKNQNIKNFINKELKYESWNYDTQIIINACNKKKEKDLIIVNHIKECYNFMIFRYLEEKVVNFPKIVVSKEGNHKSFKWIFTCYNKHEGEDPVRWTNMKLTKALQSSNIIAMFNILQDSNEEITIDEKWLRSNKASFYSLDIFEDTNSLIEKQEIKKLKAQLIISSPNPITEPLHIEVASFFQINDDLEDDNDLHVNHPALEDEV